MTDTNKKNDLEDLIRLAHVVAKPYLIALWIVSILLLLSVGANVYFATQTTEVYFDANENSYSTINQKN